MIDTENSRPQFSDDWQGLREIDDAIAGNRLSAYSLKKAWADPWERRGLLAFGFLFVVFIAYVTVYDGLI